jgi:hypothetical protein
MAGYSGTPLQRKLGIKDDSTVFLVNAPIHYLDWISPMPPGTQVRVRLIGEMDFIHLFVLERKAFESEFLRLKKNLKKNGVLWISWPKKSSKVVTDLDENSIREFGLKNGLVDIKVCAVDEVWSALKFVYRLKDR